MRIKISKNLKWIYPYLLSVQDLIDLSKIKEIKGFKIPPNRNELIDGQTIKIPPARKYTITLRTHMQLYQSSKTYKSFLKYKRMYLCEFLDTLAHEICHTVEWDHTTKHLDLQLKVMKRFNKVLKKQKIKDIWRTMPKG